MQEYILSKNGNKDLKFTGVMLGSVRDFLGINRYVLYKTRKGQYVCVIYFFCCLLCYRDLKYKSDIVEYFGFGKLAKKLYKKLDINASIEVD